MVRNPIALILTWYGMSLSDGFLLNLLVTLLAAEESSETTPAAIAARDNAAEIITKVAMELQVQGFNVQSDTILRFG